MDYSTHAQRSISVRVPANNTAPPRTGDLSTLLAHARVEELEATNSIAVVVTPLVGVTAHVRRGIVEVVLEDSSLVSRLFDDAINAECTFVDPGNSAHNHKQPCMIERRL
jgi:hypothetical protein